MKQKTAKEKSGTWHGRVRYGTSRDKLLTWGYYIFVLNLVFSSPYHLLILFVFLQDWIIKYLFLKY